MTPSRRRLDCQSPWPALTLAVLALALAAVPLLAAGQPAVDGGDVCRSPWRA
jgi:hypothetical protein